MASSERRAERASDSEAARHVALALDVTTLDEAVELSSAVGEHVGVLKVGLELFTRYGPEAVLRLRSKERRLFLDLKLHDIPETVERSIRNVVELGVDLVTVHASGGPEMLRRARAAAGADVRVLAVTVLTSLDAADLGSIGWSRSPAEQALALATMATEVGVDGFVTSPAEVSRLRAALPKAYLVTPGVRPAGSAAGDQKRISSPRDAIAAGADLLVVGRPIRDAADRKAVAHAILVEVIEGLAAREGARA
jgi:orotidine-5'-phosphate decarboxylase